MRYYPIVLIALVLSICMASQLCSKNCDECSTPFSCTQCDDGFYLTTSNTCRSCPQGCENCSAPTEIGMMPVCNECKGKFTYDAITESCFVCSKNCKECEESSENCISCEQGYELMNNTADGFSNNQFCYRNSECRNSRCSECASGEENKCASCKSNYFLKQDGQCSSCPFPCASCEFDLDTTSVVAKFDEGMKKMEETIKKYNDWMSLYQKFMNAYNKYKWDQQYDATVTLTQYLGNQDYSALGQIQDMENLTFTEPQLRTMMADAQLKEFVDDNFFDDFEARLSDKMENDADKFDVTPEMNLTANLSGKYPSDIDMKVQEVSFDYFKDYLYDQASFKRLFKGEQKDMQKDNKDDLFQFSDAAASCRSCVQGFWYNSIDNTCSPCKDDCSKCTSETVCTECYPSFSLILDQCQPCEQPCWECKNGDVSSCLSCQPFFTLNSVSGSCNQCVAPCDTCDDNNNTKCKTCLWEFSKTVNSTGDCYRCTQGLCASCNPDDVNECFQCRDGAMLIDGKCTLCTDNCLDCYQNADTAQLECDLCDSRYFLNDQKKCQPCKAGCNLCQNKDQCIECGVSFYYDEEDQKCKRCKNGCNFCESDDQCLQFDDGILMFNNEIIPAASGCKKGDTSDPQKCKQCQDGFVLDINNKCKSCTGGCQKCSLDSASCSTCKKKYFSNNGICERCPQDCSSCSDLSTCLSCSYGYTLIGTECVDSAQECGDDCDKCDSNSKCIRCQNGRVLNALGECDKCWSDCGTNCDASNPGICTGCGPGFDQMGGDCIRCPQFCQICENNICTDCQPNYELFTSPNGELSCVQECFYPFTTNVNDTKRCQSCENNFELVGDFCVPQLTCGGNGCLFCLPGTYSDKGDCKMCEVEHCSSCGQNGTDCFSCFSGFYVSETNECAKCPQGSLTCKDQNSSQRCDVGYVMKAEEISDDGSTVTLYSDKCIPCLSPCLQCISLPTICATCISDDYRLNGTSCLKKLVISVSIRFDMVYQQFLSGGHGQNLLDTFDSKTNLAFNMVFVGPGSTVTVAAAEIDSTDEGTTSTAAIDDTISSGDLNIDVLSSSVGLYYEDQEYSEGGFGQNDVMVIILAVIGGVVIVALIVGFIIYKMRKNNSQVSVAKNQSIQILPIPQSKDSFDGSYGQTFGIQQNKVLYN